MTGLLRTIRRINRLGNLNIAEPYAGGAGASLSLLYLEEATSIAINDADKSIYDFWWSLTNRPRPFLELVSNTEPSIEEWLKQREIYRSKTALSKLRRGFSAFYLNRCNRSGIIMNGGPIGGINQDGKWKIDARYNREALVRRCEKVAEYRTRIRVSDEDGIEFLKRSNPDSYFFFIDPPYFEKGPKLYLNTLDREYHRHLSIQLHAMRDRAWVLTYDDCPEIRAMYAGWAAIRPFSLKYAAAEKRSGSEILITPKWMELPTDQKSAAVIW